MSTETVEYEEQIRSLLATIRRGDRAAFDTLIEAVGVEMRKLSAFHLRQRPPGLTLQTTALVHEAVLRMIQALNRNQQAFPETKEHLMALVAQMMRYTLTDYARKRKPVVSLDDVRPSEDVSPSEPALPLLLQDWTNREIDDLLALDEALEVIERSDAEYGKRRSAAISLYLFAGMNYREIGDELAVSDDTARRDCQFALSYIRGVFTERPSTKAPLAT